MIDPRHLIRTPLGEPGSGRVRYGAAMALHRAGKLSEAVLEVYRICSPLDHQDPTAILGERGLPLPTDPDETGAASLRTLVAEIAAYLATLSGDGPAEVRAALAAWSPGPILAMAPIPDNPTVARHLAPALALLGTTHPALAAAIATASPDLAWITYDGYDPAQIGPDFGAHHAFASLLGTEAPIRAEAFDLGLFLIAPGVLYRDHRHPAAELYAPLTGPHGWRFGPDRPIVDKPAHEPVWNPPMAPHLTRVGAVPFLCLYAWTGDVDAPAEIVPATDWATLEAAIG